MHCMGKQGLQWVNLLVEWHILHIAHKYAQLICILSRRGTVSHSIYGTASLCTNTTVFIQKNAIDNTWDTFENGRLKHWRDGHFLHISPLSEGGRVRNSYIMAHLHITAKFWLWKLYSKISLHMNMHFSSILDKRRGPIRFRTTNSCN